MTAMSISTAPATNTGVELTPGMAKFVALVSAMAVVAHLILRFLASATKVWAEMPLYGALALGGTPLVVVLTRKLVAREWQRMMFILNHVEGACVLPQVLSKPLGLFEQQVHRLSAGDLLRADDGNVPAQSAERFGDFDIDLGSTKRSLNRRR